MLDAWLNSGLPVPIIALPFTLVFVALLGAVIWWGAGAVVFVEHTVLPRLKRRLLPQVERFRRWFFL